MEVDTHPRQTLIDENLCIYTDTHPLYPLKILFPNTIMYFFMVRGIRYFVSMTTLGRLLEYVSTVSLIDLKIKSARFWPNFQGCFGFKEDRRIKH